MMLIYFEAETLKSVLFLKRRTKLLRVDYTFLCIFFDYLSKQIFSDVYRARQYCFGLLDLF